MAKRKKKQTLEQIRARMDKALIGTAMPGPDGQMPRLKPKKPMNEKQRKAAMHTLTTKNAHWFKNCNRNICIGTVRSTGLRCKKPALKGHKKCFAHISSRHRVKRAVKQGLELRRRPAAMKRTLVGLIQSDALPTGLAQQEAFQKAFAGMHVDHARPLGSETREEYNHRILCTTLSWELTMAWISILENDDHDAWQRAIQKAREMGFLT